MHTTQDLQLGTCIVDTTLNLLITFNCMVVISLLYRVLSIFLSFKIGYGVKTIIYTYFGTRNDLQAGIRMLIPPMGGEAG